MIRIVLKPTYSASSGQQEWETDIAKINFHSWGIDAIVKDQTGTLKVRVPWTSIEYLVEKIS